MTKFQLRDIDPLKQPALKLLLTVPEWLGGATTARYILLNAWTRWLILWPLIQIRKVCS